MESKMSLGPANQNKNFNSCAKIKNKQKFRSETFLKNTYTYKTFINN